MESGKGFGGEDVDTLLDVVLEDAEFVATQVGNESAGAILDGNGQDDEAGIHGDSGLGVAQGHGLAAVVIAAAQRAAADGVGSLRPRGTRRGAINEHDTSPTSDFS